ncbi:MAG: hypothetical protein ACI8PZ_003128 [Myxococcota bacterium]|jgi:hypothetical protein
MPVAILDPALDPDHLAIAHRLARSAPLRCYVEAPLPDGLGAGLTRRHDALLRHVQGLAARGEMPGMDELSARSNLFRRVWAERGVLHEPDAAPLLGWAGYAQAVRALTGLPQVEPTMLYINALLPGQELMWHTDTPEFVGLDKQDVPEWLLVCMLHSGLFDASRVMVAGGVTFLGAVDGGAFGWIDGEARHSLAPADGNAILLDADLHPHGVDRVGGPAAPAPPVTPTSALVPVPGGWSLREGDDEVAAYGLGEVRVSIQWKARCTAGARGPHLTAQGAIDRLRDHLAAEGTPTPEQGVGLAIALIEAFAPSW